MLRFLCLVLVLYAPQLMAQKLILSIPVQDARRVNTDELGQIYLINSDNSLTQYSPQGDSLSTFRNIQNGNLAYIDTRNPLKLLLFYPDFSKIIILDRMLSLKNEIDLKSLGIFQVSAVSMGMDGNIWLFDNNKVQLLKIDEQLNVLNKSEDLRAAIQQFPEATVLTESDRKVYLLDHEKSVLIFDQFANYLNEILLPEAENLQVFSDQLIYKKDNQLINFNSFNGQEKKIELLKYNELIDSHLNKKGLFLLYPQKLDFYSLEP